VEPNEKLSKEISLPGKISSRKNLPVSPLYSIS
jgi:hypothetical protein